MSMSERFYLNVRTLSLPVLKGWIRLRVRGLENVPPTGPCLVVANHTSYLDPAVVGRACPRQVHFFIKRSVWRTRGLNWFFRGMDSIPVASDARDTTGLRRGLRYLAAGQVVGVFPEGGRTTGGEQGAAQIGAGLLAVRTGCPVIPVGIRGAFRSMPTGAVVPRPVRIDVVFGHSFQVEPGRGRQVLEDATHLMQQRVGELVGAAPEATAVRAAE
jgi:1-acyl-sn-glycerol-3-phosphate acyltransferase